MDRWETRAACRNSGDKFWDCTPEELEVAFTYCARCPVTKECKDSAPRRSEPLNIVYGGEYL